MGQAYGCITWLTLKPSACCRALYILEPDGAAIHRALMAPLQRMVAQQVIPTLIDPDETVWESLIDNCVGGNLYVAGC